VGEKQKHEYLPHGANFIEFKGHEEVISGDRNQEVMALELGTDWS
jgi:hypothetical protein